MTVTNATTAPAAASNQRGNSRLAAEVWHTIRRQAIAGASVTVLERAYGVSAATIRLHANREDWPTPQRITAGACRAKRDLPPIITTNNKQPTQITHNTTTTKPTNNGNNPGERHAINDSASPGQAANACKHLLALPADPVSEAVADEVASLISQALGTLAPPASWQQLTQAYALYRQATGQDRPAPSAGSRVLIHVGGSRPRVRERGTTIEAEAVPD